MIWRTRITFAVVYGSAWALLAVLTGAMQLFTPAFGFAMLVLVALVLLAFVRPAGALGITLVLSVLGDSVAMGWWPMTKNLSSGESILYVANGLTFKPVDLLLLAVVGAIVVESRLGRRREPICFGQLATPMLCFVIAIGIGLAWGLGTGGSLRVAFFEVTPLLYIPLVYLAATNTFTSFGHYRALIAGLIVAMTIETINAYLRLDTLRAMVIAEGQSPIEHSGVTHLNMAFLLLLAMSWFKGSRPGLRPLLLLALVPIGLIYLEAERRSAIVALVIGAALVAAVLYSRDRRKFMRVVPVSGVLLAAYTVIFSRTSSQIGFPAKALRGVIQPSSASQEDTLSDLYRILENLNLNATVRSNPLLGVGFGNEFLQPYPLPDIVQFFEFADYIPHNTILYLWIKLGLLGFLSIVFMIGMGLALGTRGIVQLDDPFDAAIMTAIVAYIPMYSIFAFVDIAGDPTTNQLLGLALAAACTTDHLTSHREEGESTHPALLASDVRPDTVLVGNTSEGGER